MLKIPRSTGLSIISKVIQELRSQVTEGSVPKTADPLGHGKLVLTANMKGARWLVPAQL